MMESARSIIDRLQHIEVSIRCRKCGSIPTLVGKQYSTKCPRCGMNITVEPSYLAMLKNKEYEAKYGQVPPPKQYFCGICEDKGFLILDEQYNDKVYPVAYRCLCQAGQERKDLSGWRVVPAEKIAKSVSDDDDFPF